MVDTKEFKHTWNDLKYIFQEVVNIIDDVIEKGFFSQKEYETFDNYHIDNENNTKELIKNLSTSNLITPELKGEIEATQKEIEKLKQEINCPIKTDDSKPKGSDSDYPYAVISDCNDTLSRYLEKVKYLNELKNQAQASAINKIINGEATPPQFTELGQGTPPKTVTASRLREIQASCEDGVLGYWKPKGFKKAVTENNEAYSYCLSQSDEVFYHYKGDNYWWVDGNWYIEGNTYQCSGKAFDCFLIYDYNTAKYIPAKIEIGTSIGEDTAQFITYLLVRDIPLMLIGSGGGTIYEVALNTLADPLISYLNATDKITDEQALAAGLTTILAGNVKHLTPENITKIKTVLTEKVKIIKQKTGKNAKDIAFD
ncbi:hypothetical protein BPO_p0058 (plasmid) [Bergeyella porcorum]|uniref:Uncharacterized protein n=1 Tax=Bergeyella porcorum TaxID=1735111 RepID=A0AAU0F5B5_9FLAO